MGALFNIVQGVLKQSYNFIYNIDVSIKFWYMTIRTILDMNSIRVSKGLADRYYRFAGAGYVAAAATADRHGGSHRNVAP